jgi:hypothetical protein
MGFERCFRRIPRKGSRRKPYFKEYSVSNWGHPTGFRVLVPELCGSRLSRLLSKARDMLCHDP